MLLLGARLTSLTIAIHQNQGAAYGIGPGQCILKSGNINFVSTTSLLSTRIAVLNTRYIASTYRGLQFRSYLADHEQNLVRPSRVRNKIDK
jgi:hypothetical protein